MGRLDCFVVCPSICPQHFQKHQKLLYSFMFVIMFMIINTWVYFRLSVCAHCYQHAVFFLLKCQQLKVHLRIFENYKLRSSKPQLAPNHVKKY